MAGALRFKHAIKLGRSLSRSLSRDFPREKIIQAQCRRLPGLLILFFYARTLNYYIYILRL